ncbi:hypothetical protein NQ318_009545 [Aromia moschata]|uniref:Uncharacterized protein n=1 Tax=Aromia moschata TaxID=1265417 RepID=A0AAV8YB36_9CUCU|nr:hypothetical protein NQ318_009545 [Aromia moschata]
MKFPKVFPTNDHFKVTMYANFLLGVWPFVFEDSPRLRKLYAFYANFTFLYYLLFILSAYVKLFMLIFDKEFKVKEIMSNICITLLYSITIIRVYAIRTERIKKLIREVMDVEQLIYDSEDEELIDIYRDYTHQSQVSNITFLVNIVMETIFYFLHPLYHDKIEEFDAATNQTTIIKVLPLSSWIPYDEQKHYLISYLWNILDGCIGASYVMYTDIFAFSLIIFPLGQIKILMYILRNFGKYVEKIRKQLGCDRDEASFLTVRECILKQKDIIR